VFEGGDADRCDGVRNRGTGFTDQELESRFAQRSDGTQNDHLMDEETVRRMLAEERRLLEKPPPPVPEVTAAPVAEPLRERAEEEHNAPLVKPRARVVVECSSSEDERFIADAARRRIAAERVENESRRESEATQRAEAPGRPPGPEHLERGGGAAAAGSAPSGGSGATAEPRSTSPAAPQVSFRPGDNVTLMGLKASAHLNGERVRLERFDIGSGRWEVRLNDGDAKAIKPENLEATATAQDDVWVPPKSPELNPQQEPDVAPRSPPHAATAAAAAAARPSSLPATSGAPAALGPVSQGPPAAAGPRSGEVAGLSSASLVSKVPPAISASTPRSSFPAAARRHRRAGTIRWYNGRRKLGVVIPDEGDKDLFIPAQGAVNGSQVPPQPGGLFHGTKVTFLPTGLKPAEVGSGNASGGADKKAKGETVCMDVRPLPGQVGLSCGVDTFIGAKERNDDRVAATDLHELGFLAGVFDGHRGHMCADFVAKQLPNTVLQCYRARQKREGGVAKLTHTQEAALITGALIEAFEATDKAFLPTAKKKEMMDGSTGVIGLVSHGYEVPIVPTGGIAHLWPKREESSVEKPPGTVPRAPGGVAKLFVAWCGDSRAVLLRGRQGLRVTVDHRPKRRDEEQRIQRAGGTVAQDSHGIWRVGPREESKLARELDKRRKKEPAATRWFLSTSRAFGDHEMKLPDPIVIATPEVKVVDLVPEDWAVILACDGIFDVVSDQEAADIIWKTMAGQRKDAVAAAKALVQAAFSMGSRDNLTVVVMRLGWAAPPAIDSSASASMLPAEEKASDELNIFG